MSLGRYFSTPMLLCALAASRLPAAAPSAAAVPLFAVVRIQAVGGNDIRGVADGILLARRFGDDCVLLDSPVRPIAASLKAGVSLVIEIGSCPAAAPPPPIACRSRVGEAASDWIEADKDLRLSVPLPLPNLTGIYRAELECRIGGELPASLAVPLYVTYAKPRPMVDPPEELWYQRACEWGGGLDSGAGESAVADQILHRLFYFGQRRWRYGTCNVEGETCVFGATRTSILGLRCNCSAGICKTDWSELVQAHPDRNFSDCYQFSAVFEYIAATMGIGGMVDLEELGEYKLGFMTRPTTRSLDGDFAGNLWCGVQSSPCAYSFWNHDLRQRGGRIGGHIYDATFGGIYASAGELLGQSVTQQSGGGVRFEVATACRQGKGYGNYGRLLELLPEAPQACPVSSATPAVFGTSPPRLRLLSVDESPDPEVVALDVEVVIEQEGSYWVRRGMLSSGDGREAVTARQERGWVDLLSEAPVAGPPGTYWARLIFSGEDVARSARSSFRLKADLEEAGTAAVVDKLEAVVNPSWRLEDLSSLGEGDARLGRRPGDLELSWQPSPAHVLRATLPLRVRVPGGFAVEARLARGEETLAYGGYRRDFARGEQELQVDFSLREVPPPDAGPFQIAIALHRLDPPSPVDSVALTVPQLPPVPANP